MQYLNFIFFEFGSILVWGLIWFIWPQVPALETLSSSPTIFGAPPRSANPSTRPSRNRTPWWPIPSPASPSRPPTSYPSTSHRCWTTTRLPWRRNKSATCAPWPGTRWRITRRAPCCAPPATSSPWSVWTRSSAKTWSTRRVEKHSAKRTLSPCSGEEAATRGVDWSWRVASLSRPCMWAD